MKVLDLSQLSTEVRQLVEGHLHLLMQDGTVDEIQREGREVSLLDFPEDIRTKVYEELRKPNYPMIHGMGDEFAPEHPESTSRTEGTISREDVEAVRTAFLRRGLKHGGGFKSSGFEKQESKVFPGRSLNDAVRESFTSRKPVSERTE